jgi:hypothetical protein
MGRRRGPRPSEPFGACQRHQQHCTPDDATSSTMAKNTVPHPDHATVKPNINFSTRCSLLNSGTAFV